MNRIGCRTTRGDGIDALLAVMTPDENYTADALATRLGLTVSTTRMMLHAAEDTGVLWQRRVPKGPLEWVRRERRRDPSASTARPAGELHGYEYEWRKFRELCMLTRA